MNKFYFFSKQDCVPCALVHKYLNSIKIDASIVEKIDLMKNLDLAEKYGIFTTPVLLVIKGDDEDCVIEEHVGGLNITQNIKRLIETYA